MFEVFGALSKVPIMDLLKALGALSVVIAGVTYLVMRYNYSKGELPDIVEDIYMSTNDAGKVVFHSWGSQRSLADVFVSPVLRKRIISGAKKHAGPHGEVVLGLAKDHKFMMSSTRDWYTGEDKRAVMAAMNDRPVHRDKIWFGVVYGEDEDGIKMLRRFMIADRKIKDLANDTKRALLEPEDRDQQSWIDLVGVLAKRHVAEQKADVAWRSRALWDAVVETSKTEAVAVSSGGATSDHHVAAE